MKNKVDICISAIAILMFATTLTVTACKNQNQEDTKEVAQEKNEAKFEDTKEDDAKFLVDASEFNLQQAELGKLVSVKSNNNDVKAFAQMMHDMHQVKTQEINAFASSKQVSVPASLTDENKEDYNSLNKKDIDDFDKQYIDVVVKNHKDAIDKYTEELEKTTDPDIKKWLVIETASLREHLDSAMNLQMKLDRK